jgi:DNA-binding transcriptional MerR regulator
MVSEDEMLLISEVSEKTGISANTLRLWARTGQLKEYEARKVPTGHVYYTTIRAALERQKNTKMGRPPKSRV